MTAVRWACPGVRRRPFWRSAAPASVRPARSPPDAGRPARGGLTAPGSEPARSVRGRSVRTRSGRGPSPSGRRRGRASELPAPPSRLGRPESRPEGGRPPARSWRGGRLSPPSRLRSLGRRSERPTSWVVTPGVSPRGGPMTSIRAGSERASVFGGITETMLMPSHSKSASAFSTSPVLAAGGSNDPSRTPLGSRAPAARHVHDPSGRALVSSISIRRGTPLRYRRVRRPS